MTSTNPSQVNKENDYQLKWYKAGGDNPYGVEILDLRGFTQIAKATSDNKTIINSFNEGRDNNDSTQYKTAFIKNANTYSANISFPLNGLVLQGAVYKADSMKIKWDIFADNEWLYFVKSWTGELVYKAHYLKKADRVEIDEIITGAVARMSSTDEEKETYAAQNVYSMIQTHLLDRTWPYKIPEMMRGIPEENIALHMFALFGYKATIATYANVLDITFTEQAL